jgi:hypothetical protein
MDIMGVAQSLAGRVLDLLARASHNTGRLWQQESRKLHQASPSYASLNTRITPGEEHRPHIQRHRG